MKFRYARVSTTAQKLESQIENLKAAGAEKIYGSIAKFPRQTILAVRYYLLFNLSYRDVQEMLYDRGIKVCYSTIQRRVNVCISELYGFFIISSKLLLK